jgi:hypothetical protein
VGDDENLKWFRAILATNQIKRRQSNEEMI